MIPHSLVCIISPLLSTRDLFWDHLNISWIHLESGSAPNFNGFFPGAGSNQSIRFHPNGLCGKDGVIWYLLGGTGRSQNQGAMWSHLAYRSKTNKSGGCCWPLCVFNFSLTLIKSLSKLLYDFLCVSAFLIIKILLTEPGSVSQVIAAINHKP